MMTCCRKTILSSQVGENVQMELPLFLELFKFHICLINILQLQGLCLLDQKLWIQWRQDPGPSALAQSPMHATTI